MENIRGIRPLWKEAYLRLEACGEDDLVDAFANGTNMFT